MRAVIYLFKNHKKINGTLFYCFEYFLCAKELEKNLKFIIYNISSSDLCNVKKIFQEKYEFNQEYLDDVVGISSLKELFELKLVKSLILDIHTFEALNAVLKSDIICYSNDTHQMVRSELKKITYYGFYDYQVFDYKVPLKLNFSAFKPIKQKDPNSLLISSLRFNYDEIQVPNELKHLKVLTKQPSTHHANMHELFDTLFYYHSAHEKNNRLIPECFFYEKKIYIEYNGVYSDSVYLRYSDILVNGLSNYKLESSDIMLQDFLS